jgi:hypothetical protein
VWFQVQKSAMRIIIKKLDSQKEPFDVEEKDTVKKLKEMLADKVCWQRYSRSRCETRLTRALCCC